MPLTLNYQGRVIVGNSVFNGTGQFKFSIVRADGAQVFWTSSVDLNSDGEPDNFVSLPVTRGLYSIMLGDTNVANMAAFPANLFANENVRLRVWFNDGVHGFEALQPDQALGAAAYAMLADSVPDGAITGRKLASGALVATNLVGKLAPQQIPPLNASAITSGQFSLARMPDLLPAKIKGPGTFTTNLIPGLDASKLVSGVLSTSRLPSDLAYKSTDLVAMSNSLSGQLSANSAQLATQIVVLRTQVVALASSVGTGSGGVISLDRIPNLDASKITSGTLDPARIPAIPAAKITGVLPASALPSFDASKIGSGVLSPAQVPGLDASKIASGVLDSARIPPLAASQISAGVLDVARLPAIPAAQISGTIPAASIPALDASKISSGSFSAAQIPALDASKVSSGILDITRIPSIPATQVAGVLPAASLPSLDASKIGSGVFSASQIPALDASRINSGVFDAARLPGSVVFGSDLASLSNVLAGRILDSNAVVSAEIASLTTQLGTVSAQVSTLAGQLSALAASVNAGPVSGATVVSILPSDATLMSAGYLLFHSVPPAGWVNGATANQPSPRFSHSSLWTGANLLVWGGLVGGSVESQQGGIYDPAADSWAPISTINAPSARNAQTAVWTGGEMIVWGGVSGGIDINTGGKIAPSGSAWTTLATAGAPEGREGHVAVWCAGPNRMLIWGGKNSSGLLNDGALYDPVANSWTVLSLPSKPEARFGASAVWAGDRVLIWGGTGASGALGTGAELLFNGAGVPLAWQALPTAGAPAPRSGQSGVWTGSKFVIWGGDSNGTLLNTGAAYDPAAHSWQPLPTTGAPSGRQNHSAVWTGTELLIFGGEDSSGITATGAAYNLVQNTWRSLSTMGSLARTEAGAAWSGTELIVFGGRNGGTPLGALQRLNPQPTWYFYRKQ